MLENTAIGGTIVLLFGLYFILTSVPLFGIGLFLHKALIYFMPKWRDSSFKRWILPFITGVLFAIIGIILHVYFFDPFEQESAGPTGVKLSLFFSAIETVICLIIIVAWAALALGARIKSRNTDISNQ